VHESFANYAEGIYTECLKGKQAGADYIIGNRRGIRNDRPIIPQYGVNDQGSGDMYPKGGEMLHAIRTIVNDDDKWRGILRGLNSTFWHQTVTGRQIEEYISRQAGTDLSKVFDQYLRTIMIPELQYRVEGVTLSYRWANVVPGFNMQVGLKTTASGMTILRPTEAWQTTSVSIPASDIAVDRNYYVTAKNVGTR
jgi:aminopeptidase N